MTAGDARLTVTCVLPACCHPAFLRQAIRRFLEQDYGRAPGPDAARGQGHGEPQRAREFQGPQEIHAPREFHRTHEPRRSGEPRGRCELIALLAPGGASSCELEAPGVRVVHSRGARLGAWSDAETLDILAEQVRTDLVVWWSPLDWMASTRLTRQISALQSAGRQYAELQSAERGTATPVAAGTPSAASIPGVVGSDALTYVLSRGEATTTPGPLLETALLRTAVLQRAARTGTPISADDLDPMVDPSWYVRVLERPAGRRQGRRPFGEVLDRIGTDARLYAAWRSVSAPTPSRPSGIPTAGGDPVRRATLPAAPRPLQVVAPLLVYDGLGSMGEYLVRSVARAGVAVNVTPLQLHREGLHPETLAALDSSSPRPSDPTLCLAWVGQPLAGLTPSRPLFVNAMWESDTLPAGFADRLNTARAVIVPSTWVREVFRTSGVRVPIEVVPQGIDPERYHPTERRTTTTATSPRTPGLTTLIVAAFAARKNIPESVAAWQAAFAGDPTARLIVKSRSQLRSYRCDDPRVMVVDNREATAGIAHWYAAADVALALGGEGFGLPLVEAMACGLPVVALDAQGQHDVVADAGDRLLAVPAAAWVPYDDGTYRVGARAVPDLDAVADRLRWVAEHREDAAELGRRASAWAIAERNVWDMGPGMLTAMRRHLRPGELDFASIGPARRGHPHDAGSGPSRPLPTHPAPSAPVTDRPGRALLAPRRDATPAGQH